MKNIIQVLCAVTEFRVVCFLTIDPHSLFPEKAMAPHSSTLAWKIPWAEEPGRLQSMGSRRVGHDWTTSLSLFTSMHWRRKWQPTPVFLPGESQGQGAWWAAIYGVSRSWTQLKQLSSSSSSLFQVSFSFKAHVYSNLIEGYVPRTFLELSVSSAGNTFLFFTIFQNPSHPSRFR